MATTKTKARTPAAARDAATGTAGDAPGDGGALRLLVLGTGSMARHHVLGFKKDPRVAVVAAVDVDAARAAAFAAEHGIGRSFGALADALAWGGFDAACNVTPDGVHHATTMALIAAGKHVLCEKPLAPNFADADEMARAAEAAGLVGMVNLTYRNVAHLERARQLVAAGGIGAIRHIEASYRQSWLVGKYWGDWRTEPTWLWRLSSAHGSRGVLGDIGIHIIDFATHVVGALPTSVHARLQTFDKAAGGRIGDYVLDANDSAVLSCEFPGGALGVIHTSRFMTGYGNVLRLHVFGTEGALELDHRSTSTRLTVCTGDDVDTLSWREIGAEEVPTNYRRFADAVLDGAPRDPDFRRAADLQKILDACF
jgi:predicted dehydrogenase